MNAFGIAIVGGLIADAGLLVLIGIRGRRRWLQSTYAACALSFVVAGTAAVGMAERILPAAWDQAVLGTMLLSNALTAILVLSLIHGETLPRRRAASFLLLVPVPVLAFLAPLQGWTASTAYEGSVLGGFMVLCLGIALAETLYVRFTSRLFGAPSFWLALGVIALIIAGPVYTYELEALGTPIVAGANLATPVALAGFALVALQADPFAASPRPRGGRSEAGSLPEGEEIVFDEDRPKYAIRSALDESGRGRSTLVLGRTAPPLTGGAAFASIVPGRHAALRALTTASEFLAASPGGLVLLEDVAGVSALSGWDATLETIIRLRHVASETRSTVVLATSRLTQAERTSLQDRQLPWWTLPDPATELDAILSQSFGSGASRLLDSFGRAHGLRRGELTADHVPALVAFLQRALSELSGAVEGTAAHGLRVQFEAAASVLRSFAAQRPEELARGKWPSRTAGGPGADLLVTAADYWRGKEMEELFAAADAVVEREPLFEKARAVYVEQLGDAGESVLRSQLDRLGKRPEDLRKADLVRIADRASVDLGALADVVDVPQERDRIQKQIESIRQRLELIVEEEK